jgi:hypothetical protein
VFMERNTVGSTTKLSSRPERTRISCHAALDKTACAPFRKEGRMQCSNATNFHRKSGVAKWRDLLFILRSIESEWKRYPSLWHLDRSAAKWRDLQFSGPLLEMFFDKA